MVRPSQLLSVTTVTSPPGIGLGVLAVGAHRVTEEILMESSRALAVAKKAVEQHKAPKNTDEHIMEKIDANFWQS
jgi:malate dehydrogenase (oxaloacetate-decarboxylating)